MHVACLTCGVCQHVTLSLENPEEKQKALCPFISQDLALALPRLPLAGALSPTWNPHSCTYLGS